MTYLKKFMPRKDVENDQRISDEKEEAEKIEFEDSRKTFPRKSVEEKTTTDESEVKIIFGAEHALMNQKLDALLNAVSAVMEKLNSFK